MQKQEKRVLIFAPRDCYPPNTGAKLRNYHLTRELARSARVSYLAFSDDAGPQETGNGMRKSALDSSLPALAEFCEQVVIVPRQPGNPPFNIVRGLIGRTPLTVLNYTTEAMAQALKKLLAENAFDFVQMEGTHLAGYLKIVQAARHRPQVLCDWHNVESELMWRYSDHAPSGLRRLYARMTAKRIADLECDALRDFDAHLTVSERDRVALHRINPSARITVIDNGVDVAAYSDAALKEAHLAWDRRDPNGPSTVARTRILFVGSMDYHANIEAITAFARDAWPMLHSRVPHLTLTIVGRNPAPDVSALAELPGIEVTGTVADVRPYYFEAVASIVPLRVGGGSRLKILESMAAGVPVISSVLGAEGLDVVPGEDILIAETPADYIAALEGLLDDARRTLIGDNARRRVRDQYDWSSLGNLLLAYYTELQPATGTIDGVGAGARG